jgi:hypothetical protein
MNIKPCTGPPKGSKPDFQWVRPNAPPIDEEGHKIVDEMRGLHKATKHMYTNGASQDEVRQYATEAFPNIVKKPRLFGALIRPDVSSAQFDFILLQGQLAVDVRTGKMNMKEAESILAARL